MEVLKQRPQNDFLDLLDKYCMTILLNDSNICVQLCI